MVGVISDDFDTTRGRVERFGFFPGFLHVQTVDFAEHISLHGIFLAVEVLKLPVQRFVVKNVL